MKLSEKVVMTATKVESVAVDLVAILAPWLAPIPSAYSVYRSAVEVLEWHPAVALAAAVAIESIGVTSIVNALRLWDWNVTRTKSKDPQAPFGLAAVMCAIYVFVTIGLTVMMDVFPALAFAAPGIFPLLALVGGVSIALRNGQKQREANRSERFGKRSRKRTERVQSADEPVSLSRGQTSQNGHDDKDLANKDDSDDEISPHTMTKEETLDAMLVYLGENPNASYRAVGEAVGRSKSWAHGQIKQLENDGRLVKNDQGWAALNDA